MCRFAGALAVIGVLLCSSGAVAETTATDRREIAASFLEVLHFRNPTTDVRIDGCRIVITTEYRRSCPDPLAVQRSQIMLDLSEVEKVEIAPFHDKFAISVELFIPGPNPVRFLFDELMLGKEEHFRRFSEERESEIADANLRSGETLWMCVGTASPKSQQSSMTLFVDRQPAEWDALQRLVAECRKQ